MPGGKLLAPLMKPLGRMQANRLKKAKGPEQVKMMGFPSVLLTTVGAKSGQENESVLGGFPDGQDAWLIIGSKGGAATHPAWFFNLAKNPDKVWLQAGNRRFKVNVASLQGDEREKAYAKVAAMAPQYGGYLTKTDREIPVVRLTKAE